ncbi:DUF1934 domain-containing protein [Clostridium sp. D2Q-11]|uniref:DUF1934 domain-containing protein n=1 Tax=Anaeromonas frigoriresistens TaxID=2683708 RepID=A0A942UPQ2_9FIRM|nr:DUF1934 domain-containing protein [Anaeromonas frigoriresistens]MBS4537014.1 DUF1934 domain-containing protein [Anaeromonas frigoriresistens]
MKDVMVKILGTQKTDDGESNKIELTTEGKFYKKNNFYYVVYDETEISGMEGSTTTLKIKDDEVWMKRFGQNNSKLSFKKGDRYNTEYTTAYGNLNMEVTTQKVNVDISDEGKGDLSLKYRLIISNTMESLNTLDITFS